MNIDFTLIRYDIRDSKETYRTAILFAYVGIH